MDPVSTPTLWTASDLDAWRSQMQEVHDTCQNLPYKWRMTQLKAMRRMMKEQQPALVEALKQDLGKEETEAIVTELEQTRKEICFFENNLRRLMKKKKASSPAVLIPAFTWIEKRPLKGPGVLVIGPSNYPIFLTLHPAVGALAAGNPTIIKPSEHCPAVCKTLADLIPQYFEPSACRVALGGVEETKMLLSQPWGNVFFTGSCTVGRLVAQQTALTMTPTVLELGGKCPCYIDCHSEFDWQLVANRIIWAKTLNCGQTCAAVDYLVLSKPALEKILPCLKKALLAQFGEDPYESELGRMVKTKPHAQRQVELISIAENLEVEHGGSKKTNPCQVVVGGSAQCRVDDRYICPTIVLNPPLDSRLMTEEIFGPILPIITVENHQEAINVLRGVEQTVGTPLCLYIFSKSNKVMQEVTQLCRAGGVMHNDALVHLGNAAIPFGGLGQSGYGSYKGEYSFDVFSQSLPIM